MALTSRFPAAMLEKMIANLKSSGKQYGIEFNEFKVLSNSHLSLAAGEYAKEKGKFHEYHEKIFRSYFTEGKDIGKIEIIEAIAIELGLDKEELITRLNEGYYDKILNDYQDLAHTLEINSTPTFIINEKYVVIGAQPLERFREALIKLESEQ